MSPKKNHSLREHTLMIVALLVIVGGGYYVLRVRQALADDELKSAQVAEVRGKIAKLTYPDKAPESEADLEARVSEFNAKRNTARRDLRRLRSTFADPDDAEALQDLKLKISKLAEASGVHITKSTPVRSKLTERQRDRRRSKREQRRSAQNRNVRSKNGKQGLPRQEREETSNEEETLTLDVLLGGDNESRRPKEKIEMLSEFDGLVRFFGSLSRLPDRVLIVQFQISSLSEDPPLDNPAQMLQSELVIVR